MIEIGCEPSSVLGGAANEKMNRHETVSGLFVSSVAVWTTPISQTKSAVVYGQGAPCGSLYQYEATKESVARP